MTRVLVVEDEPHLAEMLRRGLELEGYDSRVALTGPDGLRLATDGEFDVVVLDIMLPGLSGYEVLRQLRAYDVRIPVLMLTAKDGDHEQIDALDMGADDYLTKPFSFMVLVARLRALLRRAPDPNEILTVCDLTLDPTRRRVQRGDAIVALTPREFALLEHLMRHKGTVVTKTDLLADVWDAHWHGPANVVEVYIGYLRKKIDTPFGTNSIETHRGVGYRLADD
ncbi:response regulator transcription factor [Nocardia sp. 2YAB30]|uniref:response regulator transcription factor n=1 Tax=unclassified Nocardia TaxID=2637762 RepID=UPI003F9D127F